jgi:hypothetical protein
MSEQRRNSPCGPLHLPSLELIWTIQKAGLSSIKSRPTGTSNTYMYTGSASHNPYFAIRNDRKTLNDILAGAFPPFKDEMPANPVTIIGGTANEGTVRVD